MIVQNKKKFNNVYIRNLIYFKLMILILITSYLKSFYCPKLNSNHIKNITTFNIILGYFYDICIITSYFVLLLNIIIALKNIFKYTIILNIFISVVIDFVLIKIMMKFIGFIFNNTDYSNNLNFVMSILCSKYHYRLTFKKNNQINI